MEYKDKYTETTNSDFLFCEPIVAYSRACKCASLFDPEINIIPGDIKVIELFAGVGGFRIGLERSSSRFKTIWNNQWEPSTKRQDASLIYQRQFGSYGHSNEDICTVPTSEIPDADLLVGGFPCQDYSVATTLKRSGGINGKKGVLWWQIHRILSEHPKPPKFLMLENVDRLLGSPATQRGRDFAIILASLSDLGYCVEWRVVNAAEYGMPQRRKRTYMFAYKKDTSIFKTLVDVRQWIDNDGIMARAFPIQSDNTPLSSFSIEGSLAEISQSFNVGKKVSPFKTTGIIYNRQVWTKTIKPKYNGPSITLGDVLVADNDVPDDFFISADLVEKWEYAKGNKSLKRVNKATGFEYNYSEGAMAFPDSRDKPSRTIITGEGGAAPSRFKHVVLTDDGRYRRLLPIELERLNMFPDNHTIGASDMRRAFLMGNALVTGIVERIANELIRRL